MRHSYTSLQLLSTCEKAFALRYVENLESDRPHNLNMLRGTAFHALITADLIVRGVQAKSLLAFPTSIQALPGLDLGIDWGNPDRPTIAAPHAGPELEVTPFSVLEHIIEWERGQESERLEEMAAAYGDSLSARLRDLWTRYKRHWDAEDYAQLPLLVEHECERTAPNGILLSGRIDAVLWDTEREMTIVRDSKTHQSWPSESDAVQDLMDSQCHMGAWRVAEDLRQLSIEQGDGMRYVPQAVEFDRIRFKKPTAPKLNKNGSLSKTVTDYDGFTYRAFCASAEAAEAGYEFDQEVLDKAEADSRAWFRRSLKPLSMRAVEAHVFASQKKAMYAETVDPKTAMISPSKNCDRCEFLQLCRSDMIGGRAENPVWQDYGLRKQSAVS